jgi:hypothetical protein
MLLPPAATLRADAVCRFDDEDLQQIRRQAHNQAADALEPTTAKTTAPSTPPPAVARPAVQSKKVMSQVRHKIALGEGEYSDFLGSGSSGWIRTSNPPVNSHFSLSRPGLSEASRARFY